MPLCHTCSDSSRPARMPGTTSSPISDLRSQILLRAAPATDARIPIIVLALALIATSPLAGQQYFFDSFREPIAQRWIPWDPDDGTICTGCGPEMVFNSDNHPHDGDGACARQEKHQPAWYGILHEQLDLPQTGDIRLSVWMFEDYNKKLPFPPGHPEFNPHDQVQGWIALMDLDQTEFYAIGVHAHKNGPLEAWSYLSWSTSTDGWQITSVPRQQGFRHLEIVVHPYTGDASVEFFVDGQLVGQGRRAPSGAGVCTGIPIHMIGIGSNPNYVAEDYISNTYEFFWYDEVRLSVEPDDSCGPIRFDSDGDQDVDLTDFAAFQRCHTGEAATPDCSACRCFDVDGDGRIATIDMAAFEQCATRDRVAADPACDDP